MTRVLVVDNYDSFVYTLDGYLQQIGAETEVVRNDAFSEADAAAYAATFDAVLLSPGPGKPADAGVSISLVHVAVASGQPLLGVCLGHQAIAEAFGGVVTNAVELMHGKTSQVEHDGSPFYAGVPQPFTATRYHSLAVVDGTVPDEIVVNSRTQGGVIMGLHHRSQPIFGVQFHPESVLTEGGYRMLGNWLETAGLHDAVRTAAELHPLMATDVAPATATKATPA
ncbi:anthranilate synthase component II [Paramicrobacterium chengjingii]|uniref:Gamma-glutamyl-gamma-aminobutyrate hydrolase family protein n=1 Tax=Paramicrobacterium chengjingii TaxID=2769067 RepID=A0ABX6YIE1_9MICO|nr:gamma-glutamyl-gamma-aminobutyrate hydrolase family protein [Microbacterium chengjingii]QPZ38579.1 gamma-glutamyl-gamma-aminobutyrate hydrolase family protein [Microbacterium chengjingii]